MTDADVVHSVIVSESPDFDAETLARQTAYIVDFNPGGLSKEYALVGDGSRATLDSADGAGGVVVLDTIIRGRLYTNVADVDSLIALSGSPGTVVVPVGIDTPRRRGW
jgi:hypothetical protein